MKLVNIAKNIELSDSFISLFEKKAKKLDRYLKPETQLIATFTLEGSRQQIELTIPFDGTMLRAECECFDVYDGIDIVLEKLERQITRHKSKISKRLNNDAFSHKNPIYYDEYEDLDEDIIISHIKKFHLKPMDAYEAIDQMEMLGHNFFIFKDSQTNSIHVVYKRKNGTYGLIEPENN